MTIYCPSCGEKNGEGAKFCKKCGKSLAVSNKKIKSPSNNSSKRNLLVVIIIVCIVAIAGTLFYFNSNNDIFNQIEPIHIISTTFTTGHTLDAKTICTVNVGANHSDENISVNILYSRNGNNLNDEYKFDKTVDGVGNVICESIDSFKLYPDNAIVTIYDNEGNKLDSVKVTLHTDDSTQIANGNGTQTAKSTNHAQHSAS